MLGLNDIPAQFINYRRFHVAKYVSDHILCLPIYAELSYNDVNNICDIILGK